MLLYLKAPASAPVTWRTLLPSLLRLRVDCSRLLGETEPEVERFLLTALPEKSVSRGKERSALLGWFRRP